MWERVKRIVGKRGGGEERRMGSQLTLEAMQEGRRIGKREGKG